MQESNKYKSEFKFRTKRRYSQAQNYQGYEIDEDSNG